MAGVWQRELYCYAILQFAKSIFNCGGKIVIYPLVRFVFTLIFIVSPIQISLSGHNNCGVRCTLFFPIFSYDVAIAEEIVPRAEPDSGHGFEVKVAMDADDQSLFTPIEALFAGEGGQAQSDKKEQAVTGPPVAEIFTGTDFTQNQIGLYAGGVTGALGPHIGQYMPIEGLKLRAVYGQGYYKYVSSKIIGGNSVNVEFQGTSEFYEAMVGYEFRFMGSIYKAYGGIISETNHIDPRDLNNSLEGTSVGAKVLLEGWHEFADGGWFSGYGSYSSGSEYYVVHGRYGRAINNQFAVGLEAGMFGNKEFDALRFGGFSRYKTGKAEITMSAGVSGDYDQPDAVYGTMQYFTKIHSLQDLLP